MPRQNGNATKSPQPYAPITSVPSAKKKSPKTEVRNIDSTALPIGLRGIISLSATGPGQGAPSASAGRALGGSAQSARKNTILITGIKKSTTSHTGCPASRKRRTVMATPTQRNGIENNRSVARNFASVLERWSSRDAFPSEIGRAHV